MPKHIAIIGGGITGLSAAYYLQKSQDFKITLLEKDSRLGGKIKTIREGEHIVEAGPDSIITTKPAALELIKEIGLENDIITPINNKYYLFSNNKLQTLPTGFMSMVPTAIFPFLKSNLFSWKGKMRTLLEPFVKRKTKSEDESLASFFTRRFGKEIANKIAIPLFAGIHAADPHQLSMQATLPHFLQMEEKYGSITKAVLKGKSKNRIGNKYPMFISLKYGMESLVEKLISKLDKTKIELNTIVKSISQTKQNTYQIITETGQELEFDGLVITTNMNANGILLTHFKELNKNTPLVSTAVVTLSVPGKLLDHKMDATGFVIAKGESLSMTACTWTSSKWPSRCPEDRILIRCYFGDGVSSELLGNRDEELVKIAIKELSSIIGLKDNKTIKSWVIRWNQAMPQYIIGHKERIEKFEKELSVFPNMVFAGAFYNGIGIPDCVRQGKEAAEKLFVNSY